MSCNSRENVRVAWIVVASVVFFGLATQNQHLVQTLPTTMSEEKTPPTAMMTSNITRTHFDEAFLASYNTATTVKPRRRTKEIDWEKWDYQQDGGLSELDRILLAKVYGEADSVFEFGLGESTYIANYVGVPRYAGVDSDPEWVKAARTNVNNTSYRFSFADIGDTRSWGYPLDQNLPKNVMNYQVGPLATELLPFDVYMVDGRWRLPCLLLSFLHASARGADHSDTIVLLHDCFHQNHTKDHFAPARNRPHYRWADPLLDLVEHSGHYLCLYKRKPTTTDDDLLDLWQKHHTLVK